MCHFAISHAWIKFFVSEHSRLTLTSPSVRAGVSYCAQEFNMLPKQSTSEGGGGWRRWLARSPEGLDDECFFNRYGWWKCIFFDKSDKQLSARALMLDENQIKRFYRPLSVLLRPRWSDFWGFSENSWRQKGKKFSVRRIELGRSKTAWGEAELEFIIERQVKVLLARGVCSKGKFILIPRPRRKFCCSVSETVMSMWNSSISNVRHINHWRSREEAEDFLNHKVTTSVSPPPTQAKCTPRCL